ncbi:TetR/AcrR family transcriptional regulator [Rhizorhabdus sp. FW153]|uniref:TetR/AcrR family transcriptional regulator n=1 Tax=Rhizorhabdus sp. FW153 TaxID=3400216 RepID=UPI003CF7F978
MPKIVDHEARRRQVAEIAATLIARCGLEGTKVRDIAALAGCSTSIVSHYFRSKHDLLLSAYRLRMERTSSRVDEATVAGRPLPEILSGVLPLDEERMDSWRIWLAFWGLATADEAFLVEQRQRSREAVDLFHRAIISTGRIVESERSFLIAQALLSAAAGIATQAVYDPEQWPADRQREILALHISGHLPQP